MTLIQARNPVQASCRGDGPSDEPSANSQPARCPGPARLRGPEAIPGVSSGRAGTAYRLGDNCERLGDLEGAITWFRRAAEADHTDAAMRLGSLLGRFIDQRALRDATEEHHQARRTDRTLMAEATRWLAAAQGSRRPEMVELVVSMLHRQQFLAAGHPPCEPASRSDPCR